jgi:hypothetical protein
MPRPLYPRKITAVNIEFEAEWDPETVWAFWRKEKSLIPAQFRPSDRAVYTD